jgi:hypothetical protein
VSRPTRILAIDPGPTVCGVVLYVPETGAVIETHKAMPVAEVVNRLAWLRDAAVVIERVQSSGISGASLLRTSEVVGLLWGASYSTPRALVYRRQVCSELQVHGAGKDRQVRERMIEMHGGSKEAAIGRKSAPGPLYGVASHGWQALGLACAAASMLERGALELSSAVEIPGG